MSDFMNGGSLREFAMSPDVPEKVEGVSTAVQPEVPPAPTEVPAESTVNESQVLVSGGFEEFEEEPEVAKDESVSIPRASELPVSPAVSGTVECPFTKIQIEDMSEFSKQWQPSMETPTYIGESAMLLLYLQRLERKHKVTMPIMACGIDPILFENIEYTADDGPSLFVVGDDGDSYYELIKVDGDLYMSCVSECLDEEYLNSVIATATAAVKENGTYTYRMVGYRKLALEDGTDTARLLNTLKLNTYEMSVLVAYMSQFENISIEYVETEGHQSIVFKW